MLFDDGYQCYPGWKLISEASAQRLLGEPIFRRRRRLVARAIALEHRQAKQEIEDRQDAEKNWKLP